MLAKKRRGPKPTGIGVQVVVRWQPEPLDALDKWVAEQEDKPTRAEAIRRLVELGLTVKAPARPASRPGRMLRAAELAANAIDKIADPAVSIGRRRKPNESFETCTATMDGQGAKETGRSPEGRKDRPRNSDRS